MRGNAPFFPTRPPGQSAPARAAVLVAVVLASAALAWTAPSHAEDAQPSAERIKAAAEEFDRGRRAYLAKDFEQAAGHFENAFRDAPSKETLRLAIRARRDAKQPARAATLAALAEEKYGSDAQTAQLAKETLAETSPELSEYVVQCVAPCTIAADSRVVSQSDALRHRVYLEPGVHDLGVSFQQGGSISKRVDATKGSLHIAGVRAAAGTSAHIDAHAHARARDAAPATRRRRHDSAPAEGKAARPGRVLHRDGRHRGRRSCDDCVGHRDPERSRA